MAEFSPPFGVQPRGNVLQQLLIRDHMQALQNFQNREQIEMAPRLPTARRPHHRFVKGSLIRYSDPAPPEGVSASKQLENRASQLVPPPSRAHCNSRRAQARLGGGHRPAREGGGRSGEGEWQPVGRVRSSRSPNRGFPCVPPSVLGPPPPSTDLAQDEFTKGRYPAAFSQPIAFLTAGSWTHPPFVRKGGQGDRAPFGSGFVLKRCRR